MSAPVDRITAVLRRDGWTCEYHEPVSGPGECSQCDDAHRRTAERVAEALRPELGELEATKLLLAATQEQHYRTIADFCAVRDALPREQVEQILAAAEPKPAEEKP